jgi:hypothetical protein
MRHARRFTILKWEVKEIPPIQICIGPGGYVLFPLSPLQGEGRAGGNLHVAPPTECECNTTAILQDSGISPQSGPYFHCAKSGGYKIRPFLARHIADAHRLPLYSSGYAGPTRKSHTPTRATKKNELYEIAEKAAANALSPAQRAKLLGAREK